MNRLSLNPRWLNRRAWLVRSAYLSTALAVWPRQAWARVSPPTRVPGVSPDRAARLAAHAVCLEPDPVEALVQRAVDAAHTAGAQYADARFTRTVLHMYNAKGAATEPTSLTVANSGFEWDEEPVGVGVRVLVDGYWGFAASPYRTVDDAVRLAHDAVVQAKENAKGPTRPVELATVPVVTGRWVTPIRIDPFTVPIEEKFDYFSYWKLQAAQHGITYQYDGWPSKMFFIRQERVVATSRGSLFTQTLYQSGGEFIGCKVGASATDPDSGATVYVNDVSVVGAGWERFLDAKIEEQWPVRAEEALAGASLGTKGSTVGRYTLVCDGATMASVLDKTLGVATQLDRALGYEANAGGTSFITDPLTMVGHLQVAAPAVTVTANRSTPMQLATVRWDDEGVVPAEMTLVKDGVLTDFQTTREQATWLAPYYQRAGRPVQSNGCAAAEDALASTMQHMPNLALAPNPASVGLTDLIANVQAGILIEGGQAYQVDFQGRNGLLDGRQMREIKNGRLGRVVQGGAVLFNTLDFWKNVKAVGGAATQQDVGLFKYNGIWQGRCLNPDDKGQPVQTTDHSVRAVAATIANQALIDPARKA